VAYLGQPPPEPPVEDGPRLLPRHDPGDDALGRHPLGGVVEVGKAQRHLLEDGAEQPLPILQAVRTNQRYEASLSSAHRLSEIYILTRIAGKLDGAVFCKPPSKAEDNVTSLLIGFLEFVSEAVCDLQGDWTEQPLLFLHGGSEKVYKAVRNPVFLGFVV
jgi:hypothetical protein